MVATADDFCQRLPHPPLLSLKKTRLDSLRRTPTVPPVSPQQLVCRVGFKFAKIFGQLALHLFHIRTWQYTASGMHTRVILIHRQSRSPFPYLGEG